MTIGLNLLFLIPDKVGGTETYARSLIKALILQRLHSDSYVLFCNQENGDSFRMLETEGVKIVRLPVQASNKVLRILFEQCLLPFYLIRYHIDVLHSLGYMSPSLTHCPKVTTIHDLNWHYYPEDFGPLEKVAWEWLVRSSAAAAAHVITDSYASKASLISVLGTPEKKVTTIYCGVPPLAQPTKGAVEKLNIIKPYIFTVTSMVAHKNVPFLLYVFAEIAKKHQHLDLVIVGLGGSAQSSVAQLCRQLEIESMVKILGWVDEGELSALYLNAEAFVFTSLYEGFGFPILEAFQSNIPVISSSAFSLSEVVGSAGLVADPQNVSAFAGAVDRVMSSPKLRQELISKGKKQLEFFSWEKAATQTYQVYIQVLNHAA